MKPIFFAIALFLFAAPAAFSQTFQKTRTGIKSTAGGITTEISFYSPTIIRVIKTKAGDQLVKNSLSVVIQPGKVAFTTSRTGDLVRLKSKDLIVTLDLGSGQVSYSSATGKYLVAEKNGGATFTPFNDAGVQTLSVGQVFTLESNEAIYGLGQHQRGNLNQRNQRYDNMIQGNTEDVVPFFQSIKGYGIFWDNYSPTTFADSLNQTLVRSKVGTAIDYYFLYGGNADGVIGQMRILTGQAPMMPLWTFGFTQSKERYKTQFELVDVVKKYRSLHVPLDGIVQDWQYWGDDSVWNAMSFDPVRFPRPKEMVDSVHAMNAHIFIVAWPDFAPNTRQFKEFQSKKMLIDFDPWPPKIGANVYDVYNPEARKMYWNYLKNVYATGLDGWWLDSTEPDHMTPKERDYDQPTFLGTYRSVQNAFPLEHSRGVYEYTRTANPAKRVILLTRSAFAGQQRYGSNTWSGDVRSSWPVFKAQIPTALNFSLSGIPYWNADIGGFFARDFTKGGGVKNPDFQELYTRWMAFAAFTPMMRSHGTEAPREIFEFGKKGEPVYDVQEKLINLRYHLIPYSYACAWDVTSKGASFMRALFMDFPADERVTGMNSEYLYGKSILVAPVTEKGTVRKEVYLPAGASWYDFWTGELTSGGKVITKNTPLDIIPLYIKAGSIVPWGPKVQYAGEKRWDNLEIRIYPGADADFTLYEDENDGYNYEKGKFTEITFHWNDKLRLLSIGDRKGAFDGMLKKRSFSIVIAPAGADLTTAGTIMKYTGSRIAQKL
jgi:alpha-D-xyloside xylohydrolase